MSKDGKASGLSEVSVGIIKASGQVGIAILRNLDPNILDGVGMPKK